MKENEIELKNWNGILLLRLLKNILFGVLLSAHPIKFITVNM